MTRPSPSRPVARANVPPRTRTRCRAQRRAWEIALVSVLASAACTPTVTPQQVVVPPSTSQGGGNRDRLARDEEALLAALAVADARLARRFEMPPSDAADAEAALHAILAEDPGTAVVDGRLDEFSFAARARILDEAKARVAGWTYPLTGDDELERVLLVRLVREERARVDEERDLPRSASELIRAVLTTWTTPKGEAGLTSRDAWLARRLDEVSATLRDGSLSTLELQELDDALDALERKADGYHQASLALTRLRVRLDQVVAAKTLDGRWETVRGRVLVHLGREVEPAATRATLEAALALLRSEARRLRAKLSEDDAHAAELDAEGRVLVEGRCAPSGQGVRGSLPPPERAAICGALEGWRAADDRPATQLSEVMALHDDVVVGLWALAIHAEGLTPDQADARYRPMSFLPPEREARLLRLAAVRATVVLGAALGVEQLTRGGLDAARARATRWLAFGDAPLDVIAARVR